MSAPKLSLRSEMSSRNSTNVSDIRKQSLFGIMDKDGTGTIDKAEFDKLYDVIEKETAQHLADQLAILGADTVFCVFRNIDMQANGASLRERLGV